jgi:hypothetical protein
LVVRQSLSSFSQTQLMTEVWDSRDGVHSGWSNSCGQTQEIRTARSESKVGPLSHPSYLPDSATNSASYQTILTGVWTRADDGLIQIAEERDVERYYHPVRESCRVQEARRAGIVIFVVCSPVAPREEVALQHRSSLSSIQSRRQSSMSFYPAPDHPVVFIYYVQSTSARSYDSPPFSSPSNECARTRCELNASLSPSPSRPLLSSFSRRVLLPFLPVHGTSSPTPRMRRPLQSLTIVPSPPSPPSTRQRAKLSHETSSTSPVHRSPLTFPASSPGKVLTKSGGQVNRSDSVPQVD